MGFFDRFKKDVETDEIMSLGDCEVVDITEVKDEMFAQEIMGKGVALTMKEGKIYSPVSGTVTVAFPTGHAFGITTANGIEVLIHIGIDTVNLSGAGFSPCVKEGDKVKNGTLLCEFDQEEIQKKGYDTTVMEVITNTDSFKDIIKCTGSKKKGEMVLKVQR